MALISYRSMLHYLWSFFIILIFYTPVTCATVPAYFPLPGTGLSRLELIQMYFDKGLRYKESVCMLLVRHGYSLCIRQLTRILKKNNLRRRQQVYTPINDVIDVVKSELQTSGRSLGYRAMWRRLVNDHGMHVKQKTVLQVLRTLDSDGVDLRKAHRLRRRQYYARGPNFIWHVDGYDKLKPFGFCIHGAIDGFSRRILWLEVSTTNNDPSVIAKYYLEALKNTGCAPRLLRCDFGTENSSLKFLQPFFRYNDRDSLSGHASFMYGKSTSNQRIEAWWGMLRRQCVGWWINLFKDLRDANLYNELDKVQVECLKFCFMHLLQAELDRTAQHWNLHDIRQQKNTDVPNGKPDVMYFVPELFDCSDYGTKVYCENVQTCIELYSSRKSICTAEFIELAYLLKPNLQLPDTVIDALQLYFQLLEAIEEYIT